MRVEACEVSRVFSGNGSGDVTAVDAVSLVLEPGEFAALTGRSGAGKTILIGLLGGLDRPTTGRVLLDGADPATLSRAERVRLSRNTGLVFQNAAVIRRMPVWENVTCGLVPLGVSSRARRERAEAILGRVGLARFAWRRPEQLSGGERQRVALARALVLEPSLVLADEPTANLDPASADIVCEVLRKTRDRGATVLVATHDPALLAGADRVLTMESGRL
jgi:putative ABC transport system ATP-binding protein